MTNLEAYILLFTDTLINNLAISLNYEFVFTVMKAFGNYSQNLMILFASFGSVIALNANYLLGFVIGRIIGSENIKAKNIVLKYIWLILLLSVVPFFGKFVPVIAGIYRYRFIRTILICSALKFVYYNYLLLQ